MIVVVVVITADWLFTFGMDRNETLLANKSRATNIAGFMLFMLFMLFTLGAAKRLEC